MRRRSENYGVRLLWGSIVVAVICVVIVKGAIAALRDFAEELRP